MCILLLLGEGGERKKVIKGQDFGLGNQASNIANQQPQAGMGHSAQQDLRKGPLIDWKRKNCLHSASGGKGERI